MRGFDPLPTTRSIASVPTRGVSGVFGKFVERIQGNTELKAQPRRTLGCRHTTDIEALGNLLSQ